MKKIAWLLFAVTVACGGAESFVGPLVYLGDSCGVPGVTFDDAFCAQHRNDVGKKITARAKRVPCGGSLARGICAQVLSATLEVPARMGVVGAAAAGVAVGAGMAGRAPAAPALPQPALGAPPAPTPTASPTPAAAPPRPVLKPLAPARPAVRKK